MSIATPVAPSLPAQDAERRFVCFAPAASVETPLRRAMTARTRLPEELLVPDLIEMARLSPDEATRTAATARRLVERLRTKGPRGGMEALVREYSLSSREGVVLMCLAEALLRIPDIATRDALIRDKIASGDWSSHIGEGRSLFVNAAGWSLMVGTRLSGRSDDVELSSTLGRLLARCGEPLVRKGMDMALRAMGEQFVTGQDIAEALSRSRKMEAKGFGYSFDMLGEAARTAQDASRYHQDYAAAIAAIGKASDRRGVYEGPGISIKLSALHPRYGRAQWDRMAPDLLARVRGLASAARAHAMGFNIDAEESDRLAVSLEILEALALDPELGGWQGLGIVVQAYGKRSLAVIDFVIDLAQRAGRRIMVRLVKGAYWDTEIKRAQVDGLADFPVYTRKVHTDLSYLACARKLLAARAHVFPQFATHNARTVATIATLAGPDFAVGDWEFQCLHGMGEPLYEQVVGATGLARPCRIYAPVGTHETLLAYLVRRLLENGANSSFVNRVANLQVPIDELVADPVDDALAVEPLGSHHPAIKRPADLYEGRLNSAGLDLADEPTLATLSARLRDDADLHRLAAPDGVQGDRSSQARDIRNPADRRDLVGRVLETTAEQVAALARRAEGAAAGWARTPPGERGAILERAADLIQERMVPLVGLICREAGRTVSNAVAEIREAIDFLRYYAAQARLLGFDDVPIGPVACISPWNFPLAIFTGQVAAALAAGNPVLAKPAEETPLVAAAAVTILRDAGVPEAVLSFLPGDGRVGAALVDDEAVRAVVFTGSSAVARLIERRLALRIGPGGGTVPLVAETGGQNAMIVDSSALLEQAVGDIVASAFDSAGQRCSSLRILCLQEDIAADAVTMLKGAMRELAIGCPDRLGTDVGPVISAQAAATIEDHVAAMEAKGHAITRFELPEDCAFGSFSPPTLIEVAAVGDLGDEVFGPVLHVMRYRRDELDALIDAINATGFGLTFGLHTRIDQTVARVRARVKAGNVYVNRNMIGAVVGSQPFGGSGVSGTGPKAGGPLYMRRLMSRAGRERGARPTAHDCDAALIAFADWLDAAGHAAEAETSRRCGRETRLGAQIDLPGPVGERNLYTLRPKGMVLLVPTTFRGLALQIAAVLATGNDAIVDPASGVQERLTGLPHLVARRLEIDAGWASVEAIAAALVEGEAPRILEVRQRLARREGRIVGVHAISSAQVASGTTEWCLDWLLEEVTVSIDTTAAGGNASLMALV